MTVQKNDGTILGTDGDMQQLTEGGSKIVASYYKEKYGADIHIVDEESESLSALIAQAREESKGKNVRIGFIIGFAAGHGVPVIYLREKGNGEKDKELVLISDSLSGCAIYYSLMSGTINQIHDTMPDIDIYFTEGNKQADSVSCFNIAMIFCRDATRLNGKKDGFEFENGTLIEKLRSRIDSASYVISSNCALPLRAFPVYLPDFLLTTAQISDYTKHHREDKSTVVHRSKKRGNEDIDQFLQRHSASAKLLSVVDFKSVFVGKNIAFYAKRKGDGFRKIIEAKIQTLVKNKDIDINAINSMLLSSCDDYEDREAMQQVVMCSLVQTKGAEDIIQSLLRQKIGTKGKNADGYTPLALAAKINNEKVAKMLVDNGAEIIIQDKAGNTPLHLAAQNKNVDLVRYLANKNSWAIAIKNDAGETVEDILLQKNIDSGTLEEILQLSPGHSTSTTSESFRK